MLRNENDTSWSSVTIVPDTSYTASAVAPVTSYAVAEAVPNSSYVVQSTSPSNQYESYERHFWNTADDFFDMRWDTLITDELDPNNVLWGPS